MTKTRLNIYIDEDLKIQLKIQAVKEKTTASEIIARLITEYLDKPRWTIH